MGIDHKFSTVTVKWADHWVDNGDISLKDALEEARPMYGTYTGFLIHENKQVMVLCSNIWEEDPEEGITISDPMYIMKKAVVERSDKNAKKT